MKRNNISKINKVFCRLCFLVIILSVVCLRLINAEPIAATGNININSGWLFYAGDLPDATQPKSDTSAWQKVNLPHTWNTSDVFDDVSGYRLGVGWYRKELSISSELQGKQIYLRFEAVGQKAEVFVNGKSVGSHHGGYTAFNFDITDYLQKDWSKPQIIAVKADNTVDADLAPPPSADFNLYGGIYRDVSLIAVEPLHFSLDDYASSGVYVDTPDVSNEKATVKIRGLISGQINNAADVKATSTIFAGDGKIITKLDAKISADGTFEIKGEILKPQLWSPESPYLYRLKTELSVSGKKIDEVTESFGVRWFSFDPNQGFFLNGKPYKLRGANRHQDFPKIGNALSNELHENDLKLIKETGFNLVLLPHYPQDSAVLDAADRLGLFVWTELPIIREIAATEKFAENSRVMMRESIRQQ